MTNSTLDEVEKLAAVILKHLGDTEKFYEFLSAGGEITETHDTFPPDLYDAVTRPKDMRIILAAVAQLRPLQEETAALKKEKAALINDLRSANDKHQSACRWAMNNANTLKSHLAVCRHDEVKELKTRAEQEARPQWKATAWMVGKKLLRRIR